jgi:hypothetical protein
MVGRRDTARVIGPGRWVRHPDGEIDGMDGTHHEEDAVIAHEPLIRRDAVK